MKISFLYTTYSYIVTRYLEISTHVFSIVFVVVVYSAIYVVFIRCSY